MRSELKQILLDVLEIDAITEDDSASTVPSWDSVRHLSLILALEERFGITFELEEIPELISVRALSAAIERHSD